MEDKTIEVRATEANSTQDSDSTANSSTDGDSTASDDAAVDNAYGRPRGPNGSAIVVGLVALVIAALIIASETTRLRVDWLALGPAAIVGIGALLVVVGAIGLVRRHDQG